MNTHLISCLKLTFLTMVLFGVAYPLLITGIATLSPGGGGGTAVEVNGKIIAFDIIGQSFVSDRYFNGRPSAVGYNAAATGGSNNGPTNPEYLQLVDERIKDFIKRNPGIDKSEIPVDMVTASGGGLDPHISPGGARIQVSRIARERGIQEETLIRLINENTEGPTMGLFGTSKVNVLKLNVALDQIK